MKRQSLEDLLAAWEFVYYIPEREIMLGNRKDYKHSSGAKVTIYGEGSTGYSFSYGRHHKSSTCLPQAPWITAHYLNSEFELWKEITA